MLFQRCLGQDECQSNVLIRDQKSVDRQKVIHVSLLIAGNIAASRKETIILLNRTDVAVLGHVNQRVRHIGELAVRDSQACIRSSRMAGNSLRKNMSGLKLLIQLRKFFSILSRHTGWMDPGFRFANKPFTFLIFGSAQNANLVPTFLVVHDGDGKRQQHVYAFDRMFAP